MKYQKTINQISEIASRFSPEEFLELINLSPVLHNIYNLGANDYKEFCERKLSETSKFCCEPYVSICGYEYNSVDVNMELLKEEFDKEHIIYE